MQRSINWLIDYYLTISSASSISTIFMTKTSSIIYNNNIGMREGVCQPGQRLLAPTAKTWRVGFDIL